MKKVAILLVCMLYSVKCLIANPVPIPSVRINEIMFDSEKGWLLELTCVGGEIFPFVKMTVSTSSGSAESNYLPVWYQSEDDFYSQLFVLTRDSMASELDINPLGDKIKVVIEFLYDEEIDYREDYLTFGDYQYSQVQAPFEGQSIGYTASFVDTAFGMCPYAKTNEPTIGESNNMSKMYGTLTGKIYDKNNQLVLSNENMTFVYEYHGYGFMYPVSVEDGTYSIKVLANRFHGYFVNLSGKMINIKPFTVDVEPDDIIEQDIYLLDDYTDIAEVSKTTDFPIRIYPNPLSGGQALRYEVGTPVKSLDCRMELVSMDGRTVFESKITDHTGSINLPSALSNGVYIANFKLNGKTQYSTRLIVGQ